LSYVEKCLVLHAMNPRFFLCYGIFCLLCMVSCRKKKANLPFGIVAYDMADNVFFADAPSLKQGALNLANGSATQNELFFTEKNGRYYGMDQDIGELVKYRYQEGQLVKERQIPFSQVTGWTPVASWYSWISDKELLLGSSRKGKAFMYAVVNVDNMQIVKHGPLDIPLPPNGINYGGVIGRQVDSTLYIAYMLYRYEDRAAPAGDTIYLASVDYPSMKTRNITKDARSTFPGGYNLFWEVSVVDKDYLYFIAEPGKRLRYHPHYKPAIMRIKVGNDRIDPDYFFPLEDKPQYEFYGLFAIGNGQALVKALDVQKIREFSDYFTANAVQYFQLDLANKTKHKLEFPLDRLDFHPNVLRDDEHVFIAIADSTGASDIWSYGLKSHKYEKGLHVNGQVLFLNKFR